ncbi:MAG: Magnesium and cobalt efflux protein CorC [Alphaproteobacteria bacterium ADurb.Bin438]|nr:MAG: Magnesium and cobalt efflux protein CorC [Alphaproteobacteria bacterium ADurb.Bin438]
MTSELEYIILFVCLICSAFFSASETAFMAASQSLMHAKEKENDKKAKAFNKIMKKPEQLIGTLLFGNNVVNILASSVATAVFVRHFGTIGVLYATITLTVIVLLFCEIMPKTCAVRSPNQFSLFVTPIIGFLIPIFNPVVVTMNFIISKFLLVFGIKNEEEKTNEEKIAEIKGAIDLGLGTEVEARHEKLMLKSVLDLAEVTVSDIMVHRKKVTSIDADMTNEEIVEFAFNCPYSRIPIYKDDTDNIVGILHIKALAKAIEAVNGDKSKLDIMGIASKPWFVLETTDLIDQLQDFKRRREHFAVVVDEYGVVLGIVTLEDLLEEIVGDINDETDSIVPEYSKVKVQEDGSYVVDGSMTIRDLNRQFDWNVSDKYAATVSGFLIYETERIPEVGQTFIFEGFEFKVLGRKKNRISTVQIRPIGS